MSSTDRSGVFTLHDRYLRQDGAVYLTGIQALVRMLLDRVRLDRRLDRDTAMFVSGYEGSPLAGYDLELSRCGPLLAEHGIVHRPAVNEELAATAVFGSQLAGGIAGLRPDGVVGVWYGKAPGLDRAGDALRHANFAGTHPRGGAVALVGDDPGAKSSTVPSASEYALADLAMPVLAPADTQDLLDHGRHAVELSRASGLWSALKVVTSVADAASTATVSTHWEPPVLAGGYRHRPTSRLLGTDLAALEQSLHQVRLPLAVEYIRAAGLNEIHGAPRARIGIVAAGKAYLDLCQGLSALGIADDLPRYGIRVLKLGAVHPLEPTVVRRFAAGLQEIVVVEEKRGFVESALKEVLYGVTGAPPVYGKCGPDGRTLFGAVGELSPDLVADRLAARLTAAGPIDAVTAWRGRPRRERIDLPLVSRTPYFCSGCPHNTSTRTPPGTLAAGGTGCSTMTFFMDPERVGDIIGITQMGGEGAQWIGMAPFVDAGHFVQNVGDGTFHHSASLAVRAAVAAGVDMTYKLLHNSAVAMTGGQQAVGALPVARIAALLMLEGAAKVIITTDDPKRVDRAALPRGAEVRHRDELARSQAELAAIPGVTVLIHDQECAAQLRRERRRGRRPQPRTRVVVNERVCEGCGDCGSASNCLSVQPVATMFGTKTRIHQSSCNADYSCLAGNCPSFLTVEPGRVTDRPVTPVPSGNPPEPDPTVPADFTVRITGIGGTGVVTVAQILATAAVIDGRHVRTLDQTGLAQKGGAVVSDVKISAAPIRRAAKLAAGECDLYLVADLLVGGDPTHLAAAGTGRTEAVVSTSEVSTGQMIAGPAPAFPDVRDVCATLERATRRVTLLDARALAQAAFGDDQYANILLLGAAYQAGALPLPLDSIEQAIRLNGVAVDRNLAAFRHGRHAVAGPGDAGPASTGADVTVPRLVELLTADLRAYQDAAYATRFTEFVGQVRRFEGEAGALTGAVARSLHKLMAYKDEYEVARLSLDEQVTADIEERFGRGARHRYQLQPPVLTALGLRRKISVGPWFRIVFRMLRAARRLRGTPFDAFGHAHVRRVERALVEEYRDTVRTAMAAAVPGHPLLLEVAALPEIIRGYDEVKLANVAVYRERRAELLAALTKERQVQP